MKTSLLHLESYCHHYDLKDIPENYINLEIGLTTIYHDKKKRKNSDGDLDLPPNLIDFSFCSFTTYF